MKLQVKVGVFDSGVGGLTVAAEIFRQLPWVSVVYFGDTEHVPYGDKSVSQLITYGDQICNFFVQQEVTGIVAACNTSSAVSLEYLQKKYWQIPIIGVVEPGIKEAIAITRNNRIGVIATEATIRSRAHEALAASLSDLVKVYAQSCPKFVPLVEAGQVSGLAAKEAASEYLEPLMEHKIDTLVLGCTHYPFLNEVIKEKTGVKVELVNPAKTTVGILAQALLERGYANASQVEHEFFVSGDPVSFLEVGRHLIDSRYLPAVVKRNLDLAGVSL